MILLLVNMRCSSHDGYSGTQTNAFRMRATTVRDVYKGETSKSVLRVRGPHHLASATALHDGPAQRNHGPNIAQWYDAVQLEMLTSCQAGSLWSDARNRYRWDFGWRVSGRWPEGRRAILCSDYALVNSTTDIS